MNKTQLMKRAPQSMPAPQPPRRRPLTAMPGYALALSAKQQGADRQDAHRMGVYERMRASGSIKRAARMAFLAGLIY